MKEGNRNMTPEEQEKLAALPAWDQESLLSRLGNDESLLQELLATFIQQWQVLFGELNNYLQAGEAQRFSRVAHTMKGASANLEAVRIRELCLIMEKMASAGRLEQAGQLLPLLEEQYRQFLQACREK
jgi:HPt (histidine-containing phosphotransfer) domain-containing protein